MYHHCVHGNGSVKKCHPVIKKVADVKNAMKKHADGCKRIITHEEVQYVSLLAKKNGNTIPSQIATDLAIATTHIILSEPFLSG